MARPSFDVQYTIKCDAGTLRSYRVGMQETEIWLDDEKIDTYYGVDAGDVVKEWKEYYNANVKLQTDWSNYETAAQRVGLEERG